MEHEPGSEPQNPAEHEINYEALPNVEEVMIPDERGINLQAAIIHAREIPEQQREGLAPGTLIIGGIPAGGENDKSESLFSPAFGRYTQGLAERGVNSLLMNPAGMGRSEGNTLQESLTSRIESWVAGAKYLVGNTNIDPQRIRLVGNSMGGHVALRLVERLHDEGIEVDRVALTSPYFYPKISEHAKFGPRFAVAHKLSRDFSKSPAVAALRNYKGELLVSFAKEDDPIKPQIQEIANEELAKAIKEERGVGYGLQFVRHNYRATDGSSQAAEDATKTVDQASQQVVEFLAA